jgi:hypothetical protein
MPVSDYHVRNEEAQDCKEYAPSDNLARLQQCQLYDTVRQLTLTRVHQNESFS